MTFLRRDADAQVGEPRRTRMRLRVLAKRESEVGNDESTTIYTTRIEVSMDTSLDFILAEPEGM